MHRCVEGDEHSRAAEVITQYRARTPNREVTEDLITVPPTASPDVKSMFARTIGFCLGTFARAEWGPAR